SDLAFALTLALGFGLTLALLPLGQSLSISVEPDSHGKSEDFGGSPEWFDNENAEHNPVMSPTDERLLPTGDQWVMMHARPIESEPSFPAERIINGPQNRAT